MLILAAALLSIPLFAADFGPTRDEVVAQWKMSRQFTLAVAEKMPEELYKFKASPEEMAFGVLMFHIAGSQAFRLAQVAGVASPVENPKGPVGKAEVMAALAASFDFCIATVAKLTEQQLAKEYTVDWYEKKTTTGRQIVAAMLVHTAHHRGQAEVYLRINGIAPPLYRF